MEKMTHSKALGFVLENCDIPTDVKEDIAKIKASIDKKNSTEKKPTATQKENMAFKSIIFDNMESGRQYTITDLIKSINDISELSNQRVSAIVRQMKDEGLVDRVEDKRKAYFVKVD